MPLRVLTLNLWGREGNWTARRSILMDVLRAFDPDVITFQETIKTNDYDQVEDFLPSNYTVLHQQGRSPDGTGNSIASRLPLGELRQTFLHVTPRVDPAHGWIGSVAAVEIHCPDPIGDLLLVHHKPSWQLGYELERELQAVAAARFVDEVLAGREMGALLAGDFDATPDSASIRFWKGRQSIDGMSVCYVDAWDATHPADEGQTFSARNPLVASGDMARGAGRRIDYIFVRGGVRGPSLEVTSCSLAFNEPVDGVYASDHFGVVADLDRPAGW